MFGPFTTYIAAGFGVLSILAAFWAGYHLRDLEAKAQLARELLTAQAERAKVEADLNATSGKYEVERARTAQVQVDRVNTVREIYRDVPAPPPSCAVPPSVLSVLLGAVNDANASASGQPSSDVRPAPPAASHPRP